MQVIILLSPKWTIPGLQKVVFQWPSTQYLYFSQLSARNSPASHSHFFAHPDPHWRESIGTHPAELWWNFRKIAEYTCFLVFWMNKIQAPSATLFCYPFSIVAKHERMAVFKMNNIFFITTYLQKNTVQI